MQELLKAEFVYPRQRMNQPARWTLEQNGRAYLVHNNLNGQG
jgi:hypothetical protein